MENRDRASGWKHAKLSGHKNEEILALRMREDKEYIKDFLARIGKADRKIKSVDIGGLCETDVPCIFDGEKTKSKPDMKITFDDDSVYRISIKKSTGGQVYLINTQRFINGFEKQYNKVISENVKRAIKLFWGYSDETNEVIEKFTTQRNYETRKRRVVADTLIAFDKTLYDALLEWFKLNIADITDFCFSKGLAANKEDWADVVWYKNELDENDEDEIFVIKDLCALMEKNADKYVFYGNRTGGSTIQLPFGFVQWHSPTKKIPGDMQFHHKLDTIKKLK